jgi:hypothetical protein
VPTPPSGKARYGLGLLVVLGIIFGGLYIYLHHSSDFVVIGESGVLKVGGLLLKAFILMVFVFLTPLLSISQAWPHLIAALALAVVLVAASFKKVPLKWRPFAWGSIALLWLAYGCFCFIEYIAPGV